MAHHKLRVIFAGTPEFAARHLAALLHSEHEVVAVYTQPDRPAGRGKKLTASPVKALALDHSIPVYQPPSLRDTQAQTGLAAHNADLLVVVAYGLILPQAVLDIPRYGCLNVHASLLPRWRGAAPIQRAIEAGDIETGVTIMQMDAGLDTGAMLATRHCDIAPTTTAASLHDNLAELGAPALLEVLADLPRYLAGARDQNDAQASYAEKIQKPEAQLDWEQDAIVLDRQIRAFNPFPVCYSVLGDQRVKIWAASTSTGDNLHDTVPGTIQAADSNGLLVACGQGQLRITQLQLPGGRALPVAQILNANRELFTPGSRFGAVDH